jgi:DNA-binding transcriptional regulator YhcF (GntR family)
MATFAEIEPFSLRDRIIDALKSAFFAGELKPGDAIVERELARQMKVGTPVIREALISLQGQGFVRRVMNTGTFVTQFTTDEVKQLYKLRVELELLALQWAKPRVTDSDLRELSRQITKIVEAGERGDRRQSPAVLGVVWECFPHRNSGAPDGPALYFCRLGQRYSSDSVYGQGTLRTGPRSAEYRGAGIFDRCSQAALRIYLSVAFCLQRGRRAS